MQVKPITEIGVMPAAADIGLRSGLVYLLLLLAIPIQYYVSRQMSVPSSQREAIFKRLLSSVNSLYYKYFTASSWQRWCNNLLQKIGGWRVQKSSVFTEDDEEEEYGESPAIEVLQHRSPQGYFATSTHVRTPRPPAVKFHVGQVVRHKLWGYRGVIIGWDPEARAPDDWWDKMHPPDKSHWRKTPNYSILVDTRDRPLAQTTYVPQDNLEVITDTQIQHPDLDSYFDSYDGTQYLMRPALEYFYPHD